MNTSQGGRSMKLVPLRRFALTAAAKVEALERVLRRAVARATTAALAD
jgi:hypothetical protein